MKLKTLILAGLGLMFATASQAGPTLNEGVTVPIIELAITLEDIPDLGTPVTYNIRLFSTDRI
jgi:hypothetical protein